MRFLLLESLDNLDSTHGTLGLAYLIHLFVLRMLQSTIKTLKISLGGSKKVPTTNIAIGLIFRSGRLFEQFPHSLTHPRLHNTGGFYLWRDNRGLAKRGESKGRAWQLKRSGRSPADARTSCYVFSALERHTDQIDRRTKELTAGAKWEGERKLEAYQTHIPPKAANIRANAGGEWNQELVKEVKEYQGEET